ncbi:ArsC/Spx/MgsR family protein [Roseibium litorale]|uniref:Arsenate reductase family protein n=1 Tax=Roseibium litorale TaxID=2803841 RepID=A0ABR9CRL9_9HYPH|nr:ArsC/Spx/MgsR family protein [Roseibium litorale]MBD8893323.1 arsenate reductase family protein [Roseibium litorale]
MATVDFYEKPGCGTNARQKRALQQAGHTVSAHDLLSEPWTAERLRTFFGETPVASWFNPAAAQIKSGVVNPFDFAPDQALALMIEEPLLIRRPLVVALGQTCAGFDREPVLTLLQTFERRDEDLESCRRFASASPCPVPEPDRT